MPATVIVLLAGIAMVWYGPYPFKLWIVLALVGIVVTALTGAIYLGHKEVSSRSLPRNAASTIPKSRLLGIG
jgi:hypothetical protein